MKVYILKIIQVENVLGFICHQPIILSCLKLIVAAEEALKTLY